jgi:hypothetical protein
LPEIVAPAIVAATIGGATSFAVARTTTRSTARVEREKLAHARREKAVAYVLALNEQMEIVANAEILDEQRLNAARQAHTSLVAVHLTLQDDAGESSRVNQLLRALRSPDLVSATTRWNAIRDNINAGKLPDD